MKLEDLSHMNALHEKLSFLRRQYHDVQNSNMIAIVHQVPKYKGGPSTEDSFIIIRPNDMPNEEQRLILTRLKDSMLARLKKEISSIEAKILDM